MEGMDWNTTASKQSGDVDEDMEFDDEAGPQNMSYINGNYVVCHTNSTGSSGISGAGKSFMQIPYCWIEPTIQTTPPRPSGAGLDIGSCTDIRNGLDIGSCSDIGAGLDIGQ